VRLAKKRLRFGFWFAKNLQFSVRFWFYKINRSFVFFGSVRPTFVCRCRHHLSFTLLRYDASNVTLPCWIGPTNCQPKWLRTRNAETRHEEKYFHRWSYHAARWIVNETMWKTVPKPPKSVFENQPQKTEFSVFEFWGWFGSVFRKPMSDIFIGFHTPLICCKQFYQQQQRQFIHSILNTHTHDDAITNVLILTRHITIITNCTAWDDGWHGRELIDNSALPESFSFQVCTSSHRKLHIMCAWSLRWFSFSSSRVAHVNKVVPVSTTMGDYSWYTIMVIDQPTTSGKIRQHF